MGGQDACIIGVLRLRKNFAARSCSAQDDRGLRYGPPHFSPSFEREVGIETRLPLLGQDLPDPTNLRTHSSQLLFNVFVAAVNMIDTVNDRFALGN
jgi:hypothetical protein